MLAYDTSSDSYMSRSLNAVWAKNIGRLTGRSDNPYTYNSQNILPCIYKINIREDWMLNIANIQNKTYIQNHRFKESNDKGVMTDR